MEEMFKENAFFAHFKQKITEAIALIELIPESYSKELKTFWQLTNKNVNNLVKKLLVHSNGKKKQGNINSAEKNENTLKKKSRVKKGIKVRRKKEKPIINSNICAEGKKVENLISNGAQLHLLSDVAVNSAISSNYSGYGGFDDIPYDDVDNNDDLGQETFIATESLASGSCNNSTHIQEVSVTTQKHNKTKQKKANSAKIKATSNEQGKVRKKKKVADDSKVTFVQIEAPSSNEQILSPALMEVIQNQVDHPVQTDGSHHSLTKVFKINKTSGVFQNVTEEVLSAMSVSPAKTNGETLGKENNVSHEEDEVTYIVVCDEETDHSQGDTACIERKVTKRKLKSTQKLKQPKPTKTLNSEKHPRRSRLAMQRKVGRPKRMGSPPLNKMPHLCQFCGESLANYASYTVHLRTHTGDRPFECQVCGKSFTTKQNLQRHERNHTGERPFKCSDCPKAFTEKKALDVHMRTHTGEKPYQCDVCSRGFSQKVSLKAHMMVHTEEKNFSCDICKKTFKQKINLMNHKLRHGEIKKYQCDECENSFFTKGELLRHGQKHTGEKPFLCSLCPKQFTRAHYLKEHMLQHSGDAFKCDHCDTKFNDHGTFQKHLKQVKRQTIVETQYSSPNIQVTEKSTEIPFEGAVIKIDSLCQKDFQVVLGSDVSIQNKFLVQKLINFQVDGGTLVINSTEGDETVTDTDPSSASENIFQVLVDENNSKGVVSIEANS